MQRKRESVWVDGSCLRNGRAGAKSGIGLYFGPSDPRNISSAILNGKQTNNRAELIAILCALIICSDVDELHLFTDSQYSIDCITKYSSKWKLNNWITSKGTAVESKDIIGIIDRIVVRMNHNNKIINFVHVNGHSGNDGNDEADRMANIGATSNTESGRIILLRRLGFPV